MSPHPHMYQMYPGNPNGGPQGEAQGYAQGYGNGPHWHQHAHPYGPGHAAGYGPAAPGQAPSPFPTPGALGLLNNRFVTGMLVGSALTYVLTNEHIQRAAIRGITQVWLGIQGGLEETKERFRDAESEIKTHHGE